MIALETVLLRLGDRIADLIGEDQYRLLKALGNDTSNQDSLVRLCIDMHTKWGLLRNTEYRAIIINSLDRGQATDLALIMGIPYEKSPYKPLREKGFRKNSKQEEILFTFFGFSAPEEEVVDIGETVHEVTAMHGLFPHQRTALVRIEHILENEGGRALLHMPTGSGKTRTAMNIAAKHLNHHGPTIVLWLAHSEELCEQAADEFEASWSHLGDRTVKLRKFYKSHDWEDTDDGIVIAGLSKLWSYVKREPTGLAWTAPKVSMIIFDEAHQSIASTFKLPVDIITTVNPDCKFLGLTATPGRTWNDISKDLELSEFYNRKKVSLEIPGYDSPIDYLVSKGYLSNPTFRQLRYDEGAKLSASEESVASSEDTADFTKSILTTISKDGMRNARIIEKVRELVLQGHERILVFAVTVQNAKALSSILNYSGFQSDVITGETEDVIRKSAIERFKEPGGGERVLCNYGVLTMGFDAPKTSAAIIARPTKSLVLYSQMVGRVLRGPEVGGTEEAVVWTVVDTNLPGFDSLVAGFTNWEDVW